MILWYMIWHDMHHNSGQSVFCSLLLYQLFCGNSVSTCFISLLLREGWHMMLLFERRSAVWDMLRWCWVLPPLPYCFSVDILILLLKMILMSSDAFMVQTVVLELSCISCFSSSEDGWMWWWPSPFSSSGYRTETDHKTGRKSPGAVASGISIILHFTSLFIIQLILSHQKMKKWEEKGETYRMSESCKG